MYRQILATIIRWLLALVAGWLVSKGIFTQDQVDNWMPELVTGIVLALIPLLWSLWRGISHRVGFLVALDLPSGSTPSDVKEATASLTAGEKVSKALEAK